MTLAEIQAQLEPLLAAATEAGYSPSVVGALDTAVAVMKREIKIAACPHPPERRKPMGAFLTKCHACGMTFAK